MKVLSLSGGKDSVATYFLCRDEIDCIIYADGGVDFSSIKKTAFMIGKDFVDRGGRFEVVSFDFFGGLVRYGWPSWRRRWCTSLKLAAMQRLKRSFGLDITEYIGIAYDEQDRCKPGKEYPLVKAGMTEKQALAFCYSHGVDFGGVYRYFPRASCFCCPLGGKQHFRRLFQYDRRLFQYVGVLNEYAALGRHPHLSPRFSFEEIRDLCESQLSLGFV